MKIKQLKLKNYRNYENFSMQFKEGLNVIIGANNSGKTNLLHAINLLKDLNIEKQIATFEVNSVLECKRRTYEVKYMLDDNSYLDAYVRFAVDSCLTRTQVATLIHHYVVPLLPIYGRRTCLGLRVQRRHSEHAIFEYR